MFQKTVEIQNRAGIHCRPSSVIVLAAGPYLSDHEITVIGPRGSVKLASILDLLTMGLQKGESVTLEVAGPKENEIGTKLADLFATEFDFV